MSSSSRPPRASADGPGEEIRPKRSSITIEYSDGGRIVIQRPRSSRGSERRSSRRFSTQSASNPRDDTRSGIRPGLGANTGAKERTSDPVFSERRDSSLSTIMHPRHTHERALTPASAPTLASNPAPLQTQISDLDGIRTSNEAITTATDTGNASSRRRDSSTRNSHQDTAAQQGPQAGVPNIYHHAFGPHTRLRGADNEGHIHDTSSTSGSTSSDGDLDSTRGQLWMRGGNGNVGDGTVPGGVDDGSRSGMAGKSANGSRRSSVYTQQQQQQHHRRHSTPVPTPSPAPRVEETTSCGTGRYPRSYRPPDLDVTALTTPIIPTTRDDQASPDRGSIRRESNNHSPSSIPGLHPRHNPDLFSGADIPRALQPTPHAHTRAHAHAPKPPPPPHHPRRQARRKPSIQMHPLLDSLLLLLFRWGPSESPFIHSYDDDGDDDDAHHHHHHRSRRRYHGRRRTASRDRDRDSSSGRQRQRRQRRQQQQHHGSDREASPRRHQRGQGRGGESSRAPAARLSHPRDGERDSGGDEESKPPSPPRRWSRFLPCLRGRREDGRERGGG